MPDYFPLVGQVGAFTLPVQVAVIRTGISSFFNRINSLLKDIVYKLILGMKNFVEVDAIRIIPILPMYGQ